MDAAFLARLLGPNRRVPCAVCGQLPRDAISADDYRLAAEAVPRREESAP